MEQDRTPRGQEPRATAAVNRTRRPVRRGMFPMDISLGPDVTLRYIRTHLTASQEDSLNFNESRIMGWEPVKVSELPEMSIYGDADGHIRMGGTILCKNSAETVQESHEDAERDALAQAQKISSDYQASGEDGIKTHFSGSSKSTTRVIKRN